jgi:cupin 2 domain-containing protein
VSGLGIVRGRLLDAGVAPVLGERVEELARFGGDDAGVGGVRVEQILSGELESPVDYLQDHDEWVVVLAGRAALEVDGEPVDLLAGEWVLLPRDVPHRLLKTSPGTNWLAVHA